MRTLAPRTGALVLLGVLLYVAPLAWNLPLIDPDEGLHAAIAVEMSERGDYLVPRVLGVPFLDKPIAFFLAQAAAVHWLGPSELAIRLPGQLFGLLGALTTAWLAGTLAGREAGMVAGCIYATLAFPLALNQAAVHDVALVPWTNLALLCLVRAVPLRQDGGSRVGPARRAGRPPRLIWFVGAGAFLGLAVLTKGLAGVALVGLPIAGLTLVERRLSPGALAGGLLSLLIVVAIALPWYLMIERLEPGYLRYFFLERHLLGYTTTTQLHGHREWWYYVAVLLAGSVPWMATLAGGWLGRASLSAPLAAARRLALMWLALDLLFLSAAGSKLATYVLPVLPAVAILVAVAWLRASTAGSERPAPLFAGLVSTQALAGAMLLPVLCAWARWLAGVEVPRAAWAAAGGAAIAWCAVAARARANSLAWSFRASLAAMAACLLLGYATLFPAVAEANSARALAEHLNRQGAFPARLFVVDERIGSLLFYLSPSLRASLTPDRVAGVTLSRALLHGPGVPGTLVALPRGVVARLNARANLDRVPHETAGRYRLYDAAALRHAPLR